MQSNSLSFAKSRTPLQIHQARTPVLIFPCKHHLLRVPQTLRMVRAHASEQELSYVWPLALSTMAGLSTSIGAAVAVIRKPNQGTMAGLLGVAIGVMACVSVVELIVRNAMENNALLVMASAVGGGLAYYVLEPYFPKVDEDELVKKDDDIGSQHSGRSGAQMVNMEGRDAGSNHGVSQRKKGKKAATTGEDADMIDSDYQESVVVNGKHGWAVDSGNSQCQPLLAQVSSATTATMSRQSSLQASDHQNLHGSQSNIRPSHVSSTLQLVNSEIIRERPQDYTTTSPRDATLQNGVTQRSVTPDRSQHGAESGRKPASHQGSERQSLRGLESNAAANLSESVSVSVAEDEPHVAWMSTQHTAHTAHTANLLRLGLLMSITMTLHNIPEGLAVAFSAFTDFGPVMAIAIAMHNIPEGVIIAAPIYAATGSRWKAVGLATASGLSEPLGALLALLVLKPFLTEDRLQYILACVGGLMLAVCVIELWPEAKACKNDRALAIGIVIGAALMGWTLAVGG